MKKLLKVYEMACGCVLEKWASGDSWVSIRYARECKTCKGLDAAGKDQHMLQLYGEERKP